MNDREVSDYAIVVDNNLSMFVSDWTIILRELNIRKLILIHQHTEN